jgi:hypothetical protein
VSEDLRLGEPVGLVEPVVVEVRVGAAAAEDEVNGALAGVEYAVVGRREGCGRSVCTGAPVAATVPPEREPVMTLG